MNKVKIITDSCADLNTELLEKYNIDYARMKVVEDGVETSAELDWSKEYIHEFFDKIRNGKRITTAQVPATEFERIFTLYLDEGYDIVYISCSSKQSGSINTGSVIANKMLEKYPDAKIYCIDSLNSSGGEGMLAIEAAKMVMDGKSADEVKEHIIAVRKTVNQFVTVHTLDYLKRAGRVSGSSAFFGNLMGIKPILICDVNGTQTAYKKVKGRQNSIKELVSLTKESILDAENQIIYVVQSDAAQEDIDALCALIKEEIPCRDVYVLCLGPIVGASLGPDGLGVFSFGKPVTFVANEGK